MNPLSRRSVLKGAAGLAVLAGWSSSRAGAAAILPPESRPFPKLPAGVDTLPQIEHLVYFMMENHSFDNYFGMLGRGDGFRLGHDGVPLNSNPDKSGRPTRVHHAPSVCTANYGIGQDWDASHKQWDYGRLDGFLRAETPDAMAYFTGEDIPFYYSLATKFPICDRYFCSVMGQTDPNRMFMVAGTSDGYVNDLNVENIVLGLPRPKNGTIFDLLNAYGIGWKDYFVDTPTSTGYFSYVAKSNLTHLAPIAEFFVDAAAGTLPPVSYVDPDGWQGSEENPQDIDTGELFSSLVIRAVMNGAAWDKTLLLFCYDEHGGYYDHVPPARAVPPDRIAPDPASGRLYGDHFSYTGFRVPAVIVSPWGKRDYVSHVVHDHTSFLRLIETKWNLPALTYRDANASNLLDCVDFTSPAFAEPPGELLAPLPLGLPACYLSDPTTPV